jgi:hypothetical protein
VYYRWRSGPIDVQKAADLLLIPSVPILPHGGIDQGPMQSQPLERPHVIKADKPAVPRHVAFNTAPASAESAVLKSGRMSRTRTLDAPSERRNIPTTGVMEET